MQNNSVFKKICNSILIIIGISTSSAIGTQAVRSLTDSQKPINLAFLITYITTTFNVILFPLYILGHYIFKYQKYSINSSIKYYFLNTKYFLVHY